MSYPIPSRAVEMKSSGSSPVTRSFLTEEHRIAYLAKQAAEPKNTARKPFTPGYIPKVRKSRAPKEEPKCGLTKELCEKALLEGKKIKEIEKEYGMEHGSCHYWIRRWNLIGVSPRSHKRRKGNVE